MIISYSTKAVEVNIGNVDRKKFTHSLSKRVAPRSVWNYGLFRSTRYHGELHEGGFNISTIGYNGPLAHFKGEYISNSDDKTINKIFITPKRRFSSYVFSLPFPLVISALIWFHTGGEYIYLTFILSFLGCFYLIHLSETWGIRTELRSFRNELVIMSSLYQVKSD